jgi:uncharacterized coiled-coil protein SlyX
MNPNPNPDERLERVESAITHLEKLCEELNRVVIEQGKVLRRLQARQQQLSETVEQSELDRIKSTNPKPPHYQ